VTWDDTGHTLTFGWGGTLTIDGLASGFTLATLISGGLLKLTSDTMPQNPYSPAWPG
jgi:hypothetical protein